jgi:hypothetical protein
MKIKLLILLVQILSQFDVKDLTEEVYQKQLINKHIFIIACVTNDALCDKFYKDFKKEWLQFFYRSFRGFQSQLYRLIKTDENGEFFENITSN